MYLTEVKSWDIVKKQYRYKLKSYFGVFTSLVFIQLLAIFFSFNGTGMSGGASNSISYEVNYYSGDIILVFMMIWAFITAIIITTKAYRYDDFSFITNRSISHFSNILFLLSVSIFAGISVYLSTHLFQVLVFYLKDNFSIIKDTLSVTTWLTGISASTLYIFLFASAGYFIGVLIQLHRGFAFIIPTFLFGGLIMDGLGGNPTLFMNVSKFFGAETSFFLFAVKVLVVSIVLLLSSIGISNRMEVRK
ncbi:hypothetical protein AWM68_09150 [Fictibacillus phosphorivorans]|uniref:Uncharacterized protein n=1 Tax=Fictibacillus phosphorivorans TaxID=1221500 RepID=A0A163QAJ0_9BACL|nr:hypothetical protein [Fictibacillus phosphorivorans]KZE64815.1 hypothetical protein AWM68_09150 [Fictibacillus phosphorivorans]